MSNRHTFRGKRIDNGEWMLGSHVVEANHYIIPWKKGFQLKIGDPGSAECEIHRLNAFRVNPVTIDQCTGLPSTSDAFAYESDIVVFENVPEVGRCIIEWHKGKFVARGIGGESRFEWYSFCDTAHNPYIPTIVGNIHDNPEMLQEVQTHA